MEEQLTIADLGCYFLERFWLTLALNSEDS